MTQIFNPVLKSPFTDLTGAIVSCQWGSGPCSEVEMRALDCLEAYGLDRGLVKCDKLMNDFFECTAKGKQNMRVKAMRIERHRQHLTGERSSEDKYTKNPPPADIL